MLCVCGSKYQQGVTMSCMHWVLCFLLVSRALSLFSDRITSGLQFQYSFKDEISPVPDDVGGSVSMGALVMNPAAASFLPTTAGVQTIGSTGLSLKSQQTSAALFASLSAQANQPDSTEFTLEFWVQGPIGPEPHINVRVVFGFGNWESSQADCRLNTLGVSGSGSLAVCYSGGIYYVQTTTNSFQFSNTTPAANSEARHFLYTIRREPGFINARLYHNGPSIFTREQPLTSLDYSVWASQPLIISPMNVDNLRWQGKVLLVAFYNRSFTDEEIYTNYHAGIANNLPVTYNQTIYTFEHTLVNITINGSDTEGSILALTITSLPPNGVLVLHTDVLIDTVPYRLPANNTYQLRYRSVNGFAGTDLIAFTVQDDTNPPVTAYVHVNVSLYQYNESSCRPYELPRFSFRTTNITLIEDGVATITFTQRNCDQLNVTFLLVQPPTHGTLFHSDTLQPLLTPGTICTRNAGTVLYAPHANYVGLDSCSFIAISNNTVTSATLQHIAVTSTIDPVYIQGCDARSSNITGLMTPGLSLTSLDTDTVVTITVHLVSPPLASTRQLLFTSSVPTFSVGSNLSYLTRWSASVTSVNSTLQGIRASIVAGSSTLRVTVQSPVNTALCVQELNFVVANSSVIVVAAAAAPKSDLVSILTIFLDYLVHLSYVIYLIVFIPTALCLALSYYYARRLKAIQT